MQLSAGQQGTRPGDLGESGRRDLLAAARRHELEFSGVDAWARPEDLADPARVGAALEAILASISLASDLGRIPVSLRLPAPTDTEEVTTAIERAASKSGVRILDHAVPVVERDVPIGVGIDPPMWLAAGQDPLQGVREAGDRLGSFRIADLTAEGMRDAVGGADSKFDLPACLLTARVVGFQGLWTIDARHWNNPLAGIHRSLQLLSGM